MNSTYYTVSGPWGCLGVQPSGSGSASALRLDTFTGSCSAPVWTSQNVQPYYVGDGAPQPTAQDCSVWGDTVPAAIRGVGWRDPSGTGGDLRQAVLLDGASITNVRH